ncbi:hypothetical protein KUTeg_020239 [Tegillarca granosa]|uniref:Uncharacterized protein n=1 Tax=Tegillarca granosa TaxID=220873 RepID=A0ABQ9E7G7_TEGGR|nr:hypothetical protein KUTeg_020239 [Tegillarca granosa]
MYGLFLMNQNNMIPLSGEDRTIFTIAYRGASVAQWSVVFSGHSGLLHHFRHDCLYISERILTWAHQYGITQILN